MLISSTWYGGRGLGRLLHFLRCFLRLSFATLLGDVGMFGEFVIRPRERACYLLVGIIRAWNSVTGFLF